MDATEKITKNLGGNRLGSGSKNNISMHAYNRSTHDLSRAWRSSMNVGTLVPFLKEVALNGDTWTIDLREMVRTVPAIGPLYGSYKLQLDVFSCPIRLYNGLLHNNMINIGMNMSQVKLPKFTINHKMYNPRLYTYDVKKSQIANDCLIKYLGISGIGDTNMINEDNVELKRDFNAVPIIAYWDIYKNYYANKQEDYGYYITPQMEAAEDNLTVIRSWFGAENRTDDQNNPTQTLKFINSTASTTPVGIVLAGDTYQQSDKASSFSFGNAQKDSHGYYYNFLAHYGWYEMDIPDLFSHNNLQIVTMYGDDLGTESATTGYAKYKMDTLFPNMTWEENKLVLGQPDGDILALHDSNVIIGVGYDVMSNNVGRMRIKRFPLSNIDDARIEILKATGLDSAVSLNDELDFEPYTACTMQDSNSQTWNKYSQCGLGLKTHQSDLLNNWLKTEWIDGANGINEITAVDVSSGTFTIDALNLANKVYNMLNRIAVSGGTYEDWQEAVYSTEATRRAETPIYVGGLSAEIVFEEVVSTAETSNNPLGTLAGKGTFTNSKGGHVEIRVDEPSYIIGIASITPRIDYSQGNDWDMCELDTIDDLHKPALDGIGFENLLQERAAWWGTYYDTIEAQWVKLAAGKVPAWINYMTALNKTYGDFADEDKCMFMTLNRRYETRDYSNEGSRPGIADMTTYINPTKYNYSFADTNLEAQNFWVQIGIGIECRRVMSAKIIPNL